MQLISGPSATNDQLGWIFYISPGWGVSARKKNIDSPSFRETTKPFWDKKCEVKQLDCANTRCQETAISLRT
ncbi:uncharacterized protein CLUP02_16903 [Colletotrichum lupini]|uniref:Uncharacterized protein n=1 Tax=Colletotrichum lupini TaxID=145971 RepID=A0A9Q8T8U4_9PEZI|nr:uncharacterized protein CLUP02_16903 [Colletotrichum lupini]UQC91369.1 hypothetical protein CLUP02_16903 [Colletotrichum lupini]